MLLTSLLVEIQKEIDAERPSAEVVQAVGKSAEFATKAANQFSKYRTGEFIKWESWAYEYVKVSSQIVNHRP